MRCSQEKCVQEAVASYVWSGNAGRSYACDLHLAKAVGVALAIGCPLGDVRTEVGEDEPVEVLDPADWEPR